MSKTAALNALLEQALEEAKAIGLELNEPMLAGLRDNLALLSQHYRVVEAVLEASDEAST